MSRPLLLGAALSALLTSVIAVSAAPAQAVIGPLVIVGVFPSSPAASTSPTFYGTTGVGAVVQLYGNPTCTGPVIGSTVGDAHNGWAISVPVAAGSTIDVYGTQTVTSTTSACSTSHVAYTATVPPDTTITKHPKAKVKVSSHRARVSFSFASTVSPGLFLCTLDGALQTCAATEEFTVKKGTHTLTVAAFDAVTHAQDPTPAAFEFTVKKKRRG